MNRRWSWDGRSGTTIRSYRYGYGSIELVGPRLELEEPVSSSSGFWGRPRELPRGEWRIWSEDFVSG
ncbi:hypothetical protein ACFX11_039936 [Malus domestica]